MSKEIENIIKKARVAMYNHIKDMYDYEMLVTYELDYNQWKQLLDYIEYLQQENQQLLETSKAYKKLLKTTMQKEHQAIKVLDEIRGCLNEPWMVAEYIIQQQINEKRREILQILDKVNE